MASSSSSRDIVFHVLDASNQKTSISIEAPDLLKCRSLDFRDLINTAKGEITLNPSDSNFVDDLAVKFILENLQCDRMNVTDNCEPKAVAMHCAALYRYKCIPDLFEEVWDHMEPKSSRLSRSSDDQPSPKFPRGALGSWGEKWVIATCRHLITAAFVLGNRQILEEEIRVAVWGMNASVEIPVIPVDIKCELCNMICRVNQELISVALRRKELDKLYNALHKELDNHEKSSKEVMELIRQELKLANLGDLSRSSKYPQNFEVLKETTPYTFLWGIECVLLGLCKEQTPSPSATPTSSRPSRAGLGLSADEIGGKFKKRKGKDKEPPDKIVGEVIASLKTYKVKRQKRLAEKLMANRNKIIDDWREKLKH
jgi:hypothetical protein